MTAAAGYRFDGRNEAAQRWAERYAARLISNISAETRAAIRSLIVRAIREGIPVYDAARIIRGMIGLTERQAQAAMNYREELINQGLPLARVDTLFDRLVSRRLRQHSITISRTETMAALNGGLRAATAQAITERVIRKADTVREWVADPTACVKICLPLDGVRVPLGKNFDTAVGPLPGPIAHPNCGCTSADIPADTPA